MPAVRLRTLLLCFLLLIAVRPAASQTFDSSGNNLLNGTYNFRQVVWVTGDQVGDLSSAVALYGTIRFNGTGTYQLSAAVIDSQSGLQTTTYTGGYIINAAGYGYMDNPANSGGLVFGTVSNGVFVGSSTEDGLNDLFVAALATPATVATLNGSYSVSEINFPTGFVDDNTSSQFRLTPNGAGGVATVAVSGYVGGSSTETTNSISGVTYSFANNVGTLRYNNTVGTALLTGTRTFYVAPGTNLIFGGSPTGFDFFIGVKAAPANPAADLVKGLYYHAGVQVDGSLLTPTSGFVEMRTYYGAASFVHGVTPDDVNAGIPIGHQRRLRSFDTFAQDYTYADRYTPAADGSFDFLSFRHMPSADGNYVVSSGRGPVLALELAVRAPTLQGPDVYINPAGVTNAASSSPFTTGISPGELVTIYGSKLAPDTAVDSTFPLQLAGVQVLVNNRPAPIYYVSFGQISFIVPYATVEASATVQVMNNGVPSNGPILLTTGNTPGVFTKPYPGFGPAAALHADGSEVTKDKPAQIGEEITLFATGLGTVTPAITEGAVSSGNRTINPFLAYVDGITASVSFAGLAPDLRGLYQVKLTVPDGVADGAVYVDISGVSSYNTQAQLWVSNPANTSGLTLDIRSRESGSSRDGRRFGRSGATQRTRSVPSAPRLRISDGKNATQ